jgi:hypothetical protein
MKSTWEKPEPENIITSRPFGFVSIKVICLLYFPTTNAELFKELLFF